MKRSQRGWLSRKAALVLALSLGGLSVGAAVLPGMVAAAQVSYSRLMFQGTPIQSVTLYGAEYIDIADLRSIAEAYQEGPYVRINGFGHSMLLPIDEDAYRATTNFNTLQLDTVRQKGRAATYVDGSIHIPVAEVARTFGAEYSSGTFHMPQRRLTAVRSLTGPKADRLVLDLTQDADVFTELRGNDVHVVMRRTDGEQKRYTTNGKFITNARVVADGDDLRLRFSLPKDSGYRLYKVIRPGSVRVVVDAGPAIERTTPALLDRISRPLIVIDAARGEGEGSRDFSLDIARRAQSLLTKAGWQVQLVGSGNSELSLDRKIELARQSDVYLMIGGAHGPEGIAPQGVVVYQQFSENASEYAANIRQGENPAYASNAVGNLGGTRVLTQSTIDELAEQGIEAQKREIAKVLMLSEAPQAGLLLQIGDPDNAEDAKRLNDEGYREKLAVALAKATASYLSQKVDNAAVLPQDSEGAGKAE